MRRIGKARRAGVRKVNIEQAALDPSAFAGKRLLDFGCGSGASTFWTAELLPDTELVGVELNPGGVDRARQILAVSKLLNVKFFLSPDPNNLPPEIGKFDFIMLSAVYEHLLPEERRRVMPLLWSALKDDGVLFINQTPHRYFPYEHHSTGLWFINYLPDRLTHFLARKFSKKDPGINHSLDWNIHLRGGIRGGTEAEILRNLRLDGSGKPTIIQPNSQDRADYWLSCTNRERHLRLKRLVAALFRLTDKYLGTVPSINVDVVIRKDPA